MRFLLIGGTGFIGPFVAAELHRLGHEVIVFHRGRTRGSAPTSSSVVPSTSTSPVVESALSSSPVVGADPRVGPVVEITGDRHRLSDSATELRAVAPDVVIDLILSSGAQARALMDVFRSAMSSPGRVVALSSCDVYRACGVLHGSEPGPLEPLPLTESSLLRTKLQTYPPDRVRMLQQVFGWLDEDYDKIPVEQEILAHPHLPGTVLRLPMVYGPGDPLHRFLPMVKRIDDRRPAILFEEKLAAWRSPRGYVENVAAAIALAATSDRAAGRIYNVGETDSFSELEWARQIAAATGWTGELVVLPADRTPAHLRWPGNLDQHWVTDTTRIREELGYREAIARDEAIRRTIAWERANPPAAHSYAFDYTAEDAALGRFDGVRATSA